MTKKKSTKIEPKKNKTITLFTKEDDQFFKDIEEFGLRYACLQHQIDERDFKLRLLREPDFADRYYDTVGITALQEKFLEHYVKMGNISVACQKIGVTRTVYTRWRNSNVFFAEFVDSAKENLKDAIETTLYQKAVVEKDTACLIFLAKTILKDRGYTQRKEIDQRVVQHNINTTQKIDYNNLQEMQAKLEEAKKAAQIK